VIDDLTVIIPAYNAEKSIARCVESAFSAGAKLVLVVDDGSIDSTAVLAARAGARVIRQVNSGAFSARETGIRTVDGGLVLMLDADDIIFGEELATVCRLLRESPIHQGLVARYAEIGPSYYRVARSAFAEVNAVNLVKAGYSAGPPGAMLFKHAALMEALESSPSPLRTKYADDYEMLIRVTRLSEILVVRNVICGYSIDGGKSLKGAGEAESCRRLLQKTYGALLNIEIEEWSSAREKSSMIMRRARAARSRQRNAVYVAFMGWAIIYDPAMITRKLAVVRRMKSDVIFQDWTVNKGDIRIQLSLVFFRMASKIREPRDQKPSKRAKLIGISYRVIVQWILGIDLPWRTRVGPRLRIFHGYGLVVNDECIIGADVILRHGVTLGHVENGGGCPLVGDAVEFGANATVLGEVKIGDRAKIAAGSVVLESVLPRTTYKGMPQAWNLLTKE
jgi:putative colanic acid biosynthesis acetyltransferase WcaB